MRAPLTSFVRDRGATAATEMALVTPLLVFLMFGAFEMGNYFHQEHIVAVAVRDGARFAARHSFADFSGCAVASDVVTDTRQVTMNGAVSGGSTRIGGWTDPGTITVGATCYDDRTYSNAGIYADNADGSPAVKVEATVDYQPLFGILGFLSNLKLYARSEAAVIGT